MRKFISRIADKAAVLIFGIEPVSIKRSHLSVRPERDSDNA